AQHPTNFPPGPHTAGGRDRPPFARRPEPDRRHAADGATGPRVRQARAPPSCCRAAAADDRVRFAADSRSNAGVDYVSAYRKLHQFETASDRSIALLSAGSLAATQEVVAIIRRDLRREGVENLNSFGQLFEIAAYVGRVSRRVQC